MFLSIKKISYVLLFFLLSFQVSAQDNFMSLKKNKVNVRYGPGFDYKIKYIYKKINLPVKIIDKKENFRKIIDLKKNNGWIHISQLKNSKSFITLENKILFKKPSLFSKPLARINKGRLLLVRKCKKEWCKIITDNYSGWIETNNVWGRVN
jgi:SH3-like domain-containing protein